MTSKYRSAPGTAGRDRVAPADPTVRALADIETMNVVGLRDFWRRRLRSEPPPIRSGDILRRLIAWKIQVEVFGDLDPGTLGRIRRMRQAAGRGAPVSSISMALKAGTILVRVWRGVEHRVLVLDNGFEHRDKRYRSLSEVARAIARSRWSGPRFFGLEVRQFSRNNGDRP